MKKSTELNKKSVGRNNEMKWEMKVEVIVWLAADFIRKWTFEATV